MDEKPKLIIEPLTTRQESPAELGKTDACQKAVEESNFSPGVDVHSPADEESDDYPDLGEELALHVEAAGCHPVILFGGFSSGKTSLLLSLLATIKTEPGLRTGLQLGDPLLDISSAIGQKQYEMAEETFGKQTQQFIEGVKPKATSLKRPFFIPVDFLPSGNPEARFALMESDGEWYNPDRNSAKVFRPLQPHIEDFIEYYQGPITFIHVVPFTQNANTSLSTTEKVNDAAAIQDASLAISGALQAYERIRIDKREDRHLLLVTKWDARERAGLRKEDSLTSTREEVTEFVVENYSQAFAAFQAMTLRDEQKFVAGYCSGLMNEAGVLVLRRSNDLRTDLLNYPINLWKWLYGNALTSAGLPEQDPFPAPTPPGPVEQFFNWLDKLMK